MESVIKKTINENQNHSYYALNVVVHFEPANKVWMRPIRFLFKLMLDDVTNVNFLQKIKLGIKEKLENKYILYLFNTKPIRIVAYYAIFQEGEEDNEEYIEEYSEEENKQINGVQVFKSDECVICLKPANVLFCNCGHIHICEECDKTKSLNACPACRTVNTIKRNIKY